MGQIITLPTSMLIPIQKELFTQAFRDLLKIYDAGEFSSIFPCFARKTGLEDYVILNGTHRNMINHLAGLDAKVYVAENAKDQILPIQYPLEQEEFAIEANSILEHNFKFASNPAHYLEEEEIYNFSDLARYHRFESLDDIRERVDVIENLRRHKVSWMM